MKKIMTTLALTACLTAAAQSLVLLHTNDTHSNIDSDANGVGGILPRMAIIDSVRKAEKNVFLIDAGDMVQGTLYFNYFKGDVEYPLFNMMDYDIRILGNHEFDNGLEELAKYWKTVKGDRLSANYDFTGTPAEGIFKPWVIKEVEGKKIGFFGINVDPESLISEQNYKGMKFRNIIETSNETAALLKEKGCDLVVAVTHIGYEVPNGKDDDIAIARASKDIDIIIGGHSHTFVDPKTPEKTPYWIKNAEGRDVLVAQTGKYGKNVGYIKLDLSDFAGRNIDYEYIPVTDRFSPDAYNQEMIEFLAPYRHVVDSVNSHVVAWNLSEMLSDATVGAYPNWTGDFAARLGRQIVDSLRRAGRSIPDVDFGLMNVGGIRQNMPAGEVTEGRMLATFPFANKMQLIGVKGADIIETMKIVAPKGGEGVSEDVRVVTDDNGRYSRMYIAGLPVDPDRTYLVSTIDYIAEGNDDMTPMSRHELLWEDTQDISQRVLDYLKATTEMGLPVSSDQTPRFYPDVTSKID